MQQGKASPVTPAALNDNLECHILAWKLELTETRDGAATSYFVIVVLGVKVHVRRRRRNTALLRFDSACVAR